MNSVSIASLTSISALHVSIVYILAIPDNIKALPGYVFIIKAPPGGIVQIPAYPNYAISSIGIPA